MEGQKRQNCWSLFCNKSCASSGHETKPYLMSWNYELEFFAEEFARNLLNTVCKRYTHLITNGADVSELNCRAQRTRNMTTPQNSIANTKKFKFRCTIITRSLKSQVEIQILSATNKSLIFTVYFISITDNVIEPPCYISSR